ncbi:hypothetical protein ABD88_10795 [Lysinibacillus sphaericus]|nr:hypothetical protein [Lysinibacillus sphaericus]MBG9740002.1 hypothetical protein [Lysinibacillus sphaericus]
MCYVMKLCYILFCFFLYFNNDFYKCLAITKTMFRVTIYNIRTIGNVVYCLAYHFLNFFFIHILTSIVNFHSEIALFWLLKTLILCILIFCSNIYSTEIN